MNPYHRFSCIVVLLLSAAIPADAGVTVLHSFATLNNGTNQDGANPAGGLALSGNVLCGSAAMGGLKGAGALFYIAPDASSFKTFRSLSNAPDAGFPRGDQLASGNNLFGTSYGGGTSGVGTVYLVQTNGALARILNFGTVDANTATNLAGAGPDAAVILAPSGNVLFGTASVGGLNGNGVIFSVATNGTSGSVLHTFTALNSNTGTNADGATPLGAMVLSGNTLYGTTSAGGAGGNGTVFSVGTNGNNFSTLYSFTALDPIAGTNTDGAIPSGGLVLSNGVLYGTTFAGGFGKSGVVFYIGIISPRLIPFSGPTPTGRNLSPTCSWLVVRFMEQPRQAARARMAPSFPSALAAVNSKHCTVSAPSIPATAPMRMARFRTEIWC
jgi:uncharacterized repeat protein (TIGR03803 family)